MVYFFGEDSTTIHRTEKNSNFKIKFLYKQTPTTLTILCHTSEMSKPAEAPTLHTSRTLNQIAVLVPSMNTQNSGLTQTQIYQVQECLWFHLSSDTCLTPDICPIIPPSISSISTHFRLWCLISHNVQPFQLYSSNFLFAQRLESPCRLYTALHFHFVSDCHESIRSSLSVLICVSYIYLSFIQQLNYSSYFRISVHHHKKQLSNK